MFREGRCCTPSCPPWPVRADEEMVGRRAANSGALALSLASKREKGRPNRGRPCLGRHPCYCFMSCSTSFAASFTLPATWCAPPLTLSILPSAWVLVSPVRPPTASFAAPLVLSHAP